MRLCKAAIMAAVTAVVLSPTIASATGYHHAIRMVAGGSSSGGGSSAVLGGSSGSSGRFICIANPAGALICVVAVGIAVRTYQEVQMGCTRDLKRWPPRLWMPICNWRARDPNVVSVRG